MRRLAWVGAMVGLLAAVASCGGKKSASPATTTGTTVTTVTAGATTTTTVPKFSGSKNSNYCNVARQLTQVSTANLSSDPKTLFQQIDTFSSQFLAAAPSEIKGDANTVVTALKQVEVAFKAANYDPTKLNPTDLAVLQDPKFIGAANRINAYNTQVCGLTPITT